MKRELQAQHQAVGVASLLSTAMSLLFIGVNLHRGLPDLAVVDGVMALVFGGNYLVFRRTRNMAVAGVVGMSMMFVFVLMGAGTLGLAAVLWIFPLPVPAIYFLGLRRGRRFLIAWGLVVGAVFALTDTPPGANAAVKLEVAACYAVMVTMAAKIEELRLRFIARLNRLKEEAAASSRAKDQFLGQMSHELRTPLNAIIGFSQILGRRDELAPESRAYLDRILVSGRNLLEMVDTILDFARLESGEIACRRETLPLDGLLNELRDAFEPAAAAHAVAVAWPGPTGIVVDVDRALLHQALRNLLAAAVARSPARGTVTLAVAAGEPLLLEVTDGGPVLDEAERARLFTPFRPDAEQAGARRNLGLGLPIVRTIARLHGGDVTVRSAPGADTVFTLALPAAVGAAAPRPRPAPVGAA